MEEQIGVWLDQFFDTHDGQDCYLIGCEWNSKQKKLVVYVDCDLGLTLQRCQSISKYLAPKLEESGIAGDNFRLDVSSPGLDRPLTLRRQYVKNIGRLIRVDLIDGSSKVGKLLEVNDQHLMIEVISKERKKKISKLIPIAWPQIDKTFVEISFKKENT